MVSLSFFHIDHEECSTDFCTHTIELLAPFFSYKKEIFFFNLHTEKGYSDTCKALKALKMVDFIYFSYILPEFLKDLCIKWDSNSQLVGTTTYLLV